VEETNRYYQHYLATLEDGPTPLPDITGSEMFLLLAIIVQMGHDIRDSLEDYLSTIEQLIASFYGITVKRDRFFHIIRIQHFSNNDNASDKKDPNYERMWKLRNVFDFLIDAYSKYYAPSEYLAVDEVIMLFEERITFR
jgi:hypothetical protein